LFTLQHIDQEANDDEAHLVGNECVGQSVEIVVQCEDDYLKQMDIWEDKVSMVLLIGGHLETGIYHIANIERAKK
jgi:hypothetical protein